jgi:hypothetical protein
MRFRVIISLLCVLCLGAASVAGVIHHHEDEHGCEVPASKLHCLACAWHLTGHATVPVMVAAPVFTFTEHAAPEPAVVTLNFVFPPLAASRAPPETSA